MTSYLLDCLERFIKFISKNAYIQVSKSAMILILIIFELCLDRHHGQKLLRIRLERLHAHP